MSVNIVKTNGFFALYNGISAAILRQATYSTTRFAIYEVLKNLAEKSLRKDSLTKVEMPFYQKILIAGTSGFIGGVVGTPADLTNVRMQNDSKLPIEQRRNYKHCIEALVRIAKTEGFPRLFAGTTMASSRGMLVTVGQLAFYDEIKYRLIKSTYFKDNLVTHFTASLSAGAIATVITMPLDVLKVDFYIFNFQFKFKLFTYYQFSFKTRLMNAKPGTYKGILDCAKDIGKVGPSGFFKGFLPAFVRLGPHTVLTFVFLEQLKKFF